MMALVLDIVLPFGRYSATPWGHHVNEGVVEWPPAPWRIARALVASWHVHHPTLSRDEVTDALSLLCGSPGYTVPPHALAASRHYLPTSDLPQKPKDRLPGKPKTAMGLQPFVAAPPDATITVAWDLEPSPQQLDVLNHLAGTVSYLGRAESRAVLTFSAADAPPASLNPIDAEGLGTGEVLDLLVPTEPLRIETLQATSAALQKGRRTTPEGTRWVTYPAPDTARPTRPVVHRPAPPAIEVLQYEITSSAPPTMDNAALLAATFRHAVTTLADDDPDLHGHRDNNASQPRLDGHRHAHYLVLNDGRSGRVRRLVVWTPAGIDPSAVAKLAALSRLWIPDHLGKRLGSKISLHLTHVGQPGHLDPELVAASTDWQSLTPVTTKRHRKRRQSPAEFAEDIVRRELAHRMMPSQPDQVDVTLVADDKYPGPLQARRSYRNRHLDRTNQHQGFHVTLRFAQPQPGPLVLGSLAHFGLGVFTHRGAEQP